MILRILIISIVLLSTSIQAYAILFRHPYTLPLEEMKWAFGNNYETIKVIESPRAWNKRWGKLFYIDGKNLIKDDMKEIDRLYHCVN